MIQAGQYGAGSVEIWDQGKWKPVGDAARDCARAKLKFTLGGRQTAWRFPRWSHAATRQREEGLTATRSRRRIPPRARPMGFAVWSSAAKVSPSRARARDAAAAVRTPASHAGGCATRGGDWRYELKLDGYRLLTAWIAKSVRFFRAAGRTGRRSCRRWWKRCAHWASRRAGLDGEIVVLDDNGVPDFQRLQNTFEGGRTAGIRYFLFDLPFHEMDMICATHHWISVAGSCASCLAGSSTVDRVEPAVTTLDDNLPNR